MRTMIKLSGFICMTAILGIISCSDEPEHAELSPAAKQYLSMRMGSNNAMADNMNGPINQSFQSLFGQYNSHGKIADDSTETPPDSTIITPPDSTIINNPWQ